VGVEEEIRALLDGGLSPQAILADHPYKKSTVYKVYRGALTRLVPVTLPAWHADLGQEIEEKKFGHGQTEKVDCRLRNSAAFDLYVARCGLQPAWLRGQWLVSDERFLLRPGESHKLRLELKIPPGLPSGEYDLRFGLEGRYLGPGTSTSAGPECTQWSEPVVIQVLSSTALPRP